MPDFDLVKDGARQMTICNACRYCEGYCAVFPAMEQRRVFTKADLTYLANLCFDCRDCYYACQYAPPHEFGVNIPKLMSELRADTYREFTWPAILSGLFKGNALAVTVITIASIVSVLALVLLFQGANVLFATHLGAATFYRVVPFGAMTVVPSLIALYGFAVFIIGAVRFWRATGGTPLQMLDFAAFWRATKDAFGLAYMKGGGAGCNYPDERFSPIRMWFHHLVFYGFLLDFASTTTAAFYDHFLDWQAPYPLISLPVILGTMGGIGLMIGSAGLLHLKSRSDRVPGDPSMLNMDVAFLLLLLLTSITGLLLLAFRATPAMGTLLVIHLGVVAGLFITLPYGKFAHVVYRYAALLRYAIEQRRGEISQNSPNNHGEIHPDLNVG
ncbi:MAG TPA: tricarballylate utilization 4Fe-4S protein TcuB [Candidatus Binatia bacterium]|nr:tricarballylate utilization 4Fe-4S protein TcuB [Candidatus Binatia bacterium]